MHRRTFALLAAMLWLTATGSRGWAADAPASPWLSAEQARFTRALGSARADVLIVPFQVSGNGFDPAERLLMATTLADALAGGTRLTFADSILASRALGEGLRVHEESRMRDLASRVQAKYLVIGSAGHDQRSAFHVDIRVLRRTPAGEWQEAGRKNWPTLVLDDARPPHMAMSSLAPAVADLLLSKMTAPRAGTASPAAPGKLPALESLSAGTPLNVHVAQLLAMSYPRVPEPPAERAWIRTMRLAQSATVGPEQRLAIARALYHLRRRPAAIAALGAPRSPADLSLRSVMDGNLTDAERYAVKITDPALRLLALIEIRDLRRAYGSTDARAAQRVLQTLLPRDSNWNHFLSARLEHEGSNWGGEGALSIAFRFGQVLQVPELSGPQLARVAEAEGGDAASARFTNLMLAAYDAQVAGIKPPADASVGRWLMLDLMQAQAVAALLNDGYAAIDTRDTPAYAQKLLAAQEPILAGHPDFEAMRANLAWRQYAQFRGKQRERWQAEALLRTRAAFALSGRATFAIHNAERRADWTRDIANQLQSVRMQGFWTWPVVMDGLTDAAQEDSTALHWYADGAVKYAVTEYSMLKWLRDSDLLADRKEAITRAMVGRFDGSEDASTSQASELLAKFDTAGAEKVFRRYVETGLAAFKPYYNYLGLLVSQGRYAEGYKMVLRHPVLAPETDDNGVAASNYTGITSRSFWDTGRFEYAIPLLERSAGYNSGSNVSMSSAARLARYSGDYDQAARIHMNMARRYSDLDALAEYFKLIFALHRGDEAWRIYEEVYRDGNGGRVLNAIAEHARQIGWSDQQTLDWLASPKNAPLADGTYMYAPRAALRAAIIDREPVADLPAILKRMAVPSPYVVDRAKGKILRRDDPSSPVSAEPEVCGPSRYGKGPTGGMGKIESVPSSLVYFAAGYQALSQGKYEESFRQLDTAARLFEALDANCEAVSYMLPYLALAGAHTGKTADLREYLRSAQYRDRNVNYNLALAVFAAFEGRHPEAEGFLEAAINRWTSNPYQALPAAYIYADVLERLAEHTRHPAYRKRLARWGRLCSRTLPTDAWAYALEYRYSDVAADRKAALGMALFLDPRSARLKGVSAAEAAAARAQLDQANPFLVKKGKTTAMNR